MFGFGKKKLPLAQAVARFLEIAKGEIASNLQLIREQLSIMEVGIEKVSDTHVFVEVLPAALAYGLQPVRNIWDIETFERAKRELVSAIEGFDSPEFSYHTKLRLDEYLEIWKSADPIAGGNTPWDEISGRVLLRICGTTEIKKLSAVKRSFPILAMSQILGTITGYYWKNVAKEFRLS